MSKKVATKQWVSGSWRPCDLCRQGISSYDNATMQNIWKLMKLILGLTEWKSKMIRIALLNTFDDREDLMIYLKSFAKTRWFIQRFSTSIQTVYLWRRYTNNLLQWLSHLVILWHCVGATGLNRIIQHSDINETLKHGFSPKELSSDYDVPCLGEMNVEGIIYGSIQRCYTRKIVFPITASR